MKRAKIPELPNFHIVLIKPTHYDDDGYPIQWIRSAIPSNTLACLNGLATDAQRRKVLGPCVEIQTHTYDETNRRMRPSKIIRMIARRGGKALMVGNLYVFGRSLTDTCSLDLVNRNERRSFRSSHEPSFHRIKVLLLNRFTTAKIYQLINLVRGRVAK